jgi:transketolase
MKNILKYIANEVRKDIIEVTYTAKSGHPGGSLGIADVVTYLYVCKLRINKNDLNNPNRDRFILSKGHCVPAVYSILSEIGVLDKNELKTLRQLGSHFQGHPCIEMDGIEMSTGSLGQGFSVAAGMALSAKLDKKDYKVYAILGDGEVEEGVVWETAMFSGNRKLNNLVAIVDNNNLQSDGQVSDICSIYPLDKKFEAFNWNVVTCNGNDFDEIQQAFDTAEKFDNDKPTVIIMKTFKGKGVSFMENKVEWHGAAPNKEQYETAMSELNKVSEELSDYKKDAEDLLKNSLNSVFENDYNNSIKGKIGQFSFEWENKPKATRDSYGEALRDLAEFYPELIVLDADLSKSTKTVTFAKEYPERFINVGIAEQNLIGVSSGLATTGKIPFASGFAMFVAGRGFEFIRNSVGYPKLNVKIGASHAGISVGEDGGSHQCNEDIALMRAIPNMTVINPCDDAETKLAVKAALDYDGPVYMRLGRFPVPQVNKPDYKFEIGKGTVLKDGNDLTIIATGLLVGEALKAAELLAEKGINARVINIHTIKPIDKELVIKAAKETGKIITAEEHSIIGGLGSAVLDAIAECPVPVKRIGINDVFGHSGTAADLLREFGLTSDNIVSVALSF